MKAALYIYTRLSYGILSSLNTMLSIHGVQVYALFTLAVLLSTVFVLPTTASHISMTYVGGAPAYVMNLSFQGFNKTDLGFIVQSEFQGVAAIYVKPVNSSFTEITVKFSGTLSPGLEPISMSEAWETICYGGNLLNCSWEVVRVKLNLTNFTQLAEKRVNFTLKYVVMNKYNYAWDKDIGQFIGFFPFYVVPDMKWHADWNKLPKKFLYLGSVMRVEGQVVNVLTGEWKPIPSVLTVKLNDRHKMEVPTIWLHSKYLDLSVIHHYVVHLSGLFKLPLKKLDNVYLGNYSYILVEGGVLKNLRFLEYLKSIDDVPPEVTLIDWGVIRAWITLITVMVSTIACVVYLVRRKRGR